MTNPAEGEAVRREQGVARSAGGPSGRTALGTEYGNNRAKEWRGSCGGAEDYPQVKLASLFKGQRERDGYFPERQSVLGPERGLRCR